MKPTLSAKISHMDPEKGLFIDETDSKRVEAKARFPLLASKKIDGFRTYVPHGEALTRSNKPVGNDFTRKMLSRPNFAGIDGELGEGDPVGPEFFNNCQSVFRRAAGQPKFTHYLFDLCNLPRYMPFSERYEALQLRMPSLQAALEGTGCRFELVEQKLVHNFEELEEFLQVCVAQGWEGVMLRDPCAPYKEGRSTLKEGWLMKLKPFEDSEAKIVGFEEMNRNSNEPYINELGYQVRSSAKEGQVAAGCLGKLLVKDIHHGWEFSIGSGFNMALRQEIWDNREKYEDEIVHYRFQKVGMKHVPRIPVFKGFRAPEDL